MHLAGYLLANLLSVCASVRTHMLCSLCLNTLHSVCFLNWFFFDYVCFYISALASFPPLSYEFTLIAISIFSSFESVWVRPGATAKYESSQFTHKVHPITHYCLEGFFSKMLSTIDIEVNKHWHDPVAPVWMKTNFSRWEGVHWPILIVA